MRKKAVTGIIYSDEYLKHDTGPFHPESPERLASIWMGMRNLNLLERCCSLFSPKEAKVEDVESVHDPTYVRTIEAFCKRGGGSLDEDTMLSPRSYSAALLAAGGAINACELVLSGQVKRGFALVRPPGHHVGPYGRALSASSQGFCIFNNVAIAAKKVIEAYGLKRVSILDVDVHHGNGTCEVFYTSPEVLFISLHQHGIYPHTGFIDEVGDGEGEGYTVNIPLPASSSDDVYLKAFEEIIMPVMMDYKPELMLISAGFDAHKADDISNMNISDDGYLGIYERILFLASKLCQERFIAILEGGYNLDVLSRVVPAVIRSVSGFPVPSVRERGMTPLDVKKQAERVLKDLKRILSAYWKVN